MNLLRCIQDNLVGRVATMAAAIAFSTLVSLALLPLTTQILHAKDYGNYALLISIVALVSAAIDGGASLLLPAHYGPASESERGEIFASIAVFAAAGAGAAGLFLVGLWIWQNGVFPDPSIPLVIIVLTAVLMPVRAVTSISITTFSVTGRSSIIAAQMASQAFVVFVSTLVALFGFSMGGTSLFIGAACGQFAALCICLLMLGYHRELSFPSRRWFHLAMICAPTSGASGFVNGAQGFGESSMLSGASGLHAVGILSHARLYYSLLATFVSAVGHNVWASALEDARNPRSNFETTRRVWTPVQIAISFAGVVFALLGRDIVEIVSNGKLTEAANYVPVLFVIVLIQITEQPASAIVFASNQAASATWFRTILMICSVVVLYPTIALFGINGILVVCIIEAAAYRLYLRILASHQRQVPFQDGVAVAGVLAVLGGTACAHYTLSPLGIQLTLMAAATTILAIVGRRSIGEMVAATRQIVIRRRPV